MEKILTVCIPTYNMESLLSRCLDSFVLGQEAMDKLEILVVNDGSKDGSSRIGHEYESKYPQTFKVIDKKNGNYGSCINAALKFATGKYFRICDADDRYENSNLEEYIKYLQDQDVDIVFTPFKTLDFNSKPIKTSAIPNVITDEIYFLDNIDWSKKAFSESRAMHCMAVKTHILVDNKYSQTEGISYTDTQFVFYSSLYATTCSFFLKTIYLYYLGRDGQTMSTANRIKSYKHFYINAERMLRDYIKLPSTISANKSRLLLDSIEVLTLYFMDVVMGKVYNDKESEMNLQHMLELSKMSNLPCPLIDYLSANKRFKLWLRFRISPNIFYYIYKLLRRI